MFKYIALSSIASFITASWLTTKYIRKINLILSFQDLILHLFSFIPESCPGIGSYFAGKSSACSGCPNQSKCASSSNEPISNEQADIVTNRLKNVKKILLVCSGKGGVGKSTISASIAASLAQRGKRVGLLDIDICGPSVPTLFGEQKAVVRQTAGEEWSPVYVTPNLSIMSIGFLLENLDDAIIWRGPRKHGIITQFLKDVCWVEDGNISNSQMTNEYLDYLIIDTPPGTGDEHLSIVSLLSGVLNKTSAIVVSTAQEVAITDVRKEVNFIRKVNIDLLGVILNMSDLFGGDFTEKSSSRLLDFCKKLTIPVLDFVKFQQGIAKDCDEGNIAYSKHLDMFNKICDYIVLNAL